MSNATISKWAAGEFYGPVLSQTDLYLIRADIEINPVLEGTATNRFMFNISSGSTGLSEPNGNTLPFTSKEEPAILPRVTQLIIITPFSPWCTIVANDRGVTCADVCTQLWKDYNEHDVTPAELSSLPPHIAERLRRQVASTQAQGGQGWFYHATDPNVRVKRADWLRDRQAFDSLKRDDGYAKIRLGFSAPNILKLHLENY